MSEKILFLNMFSAWQPSQDLRQYLESAELRSADLDPEERRILVHVGADRYIPARILQLAGQQIALTYGMRRVTVEASYPIEELKRMGRSDLIDKLYGR